MTSQIQTDIRLVLLIHQRELKKPTNTGMIAVRSLLNSEFHTVGVKANPLDYSDVINEDVTNLLLFPGPGAITLSAETSRSFLRPIRLIVPDGNWGQATRIGRRLLQKINIPCVTLPNQGPSMFALRREAEDRPQGMATCEAISRAFALLEDDAAGQFIFKVYEEFYHQIRLGQRKHI